MGVASTASILCWLTTPSPILTWSSSRILPVLTPAALLRRSRSGFTESEVPVVLDERLTVEQLGAYVGVYELRPGFELTVSVREEQLFAGPTGQDESRLRTQGNHVFIPTVDDTVRVVFAVDGNRAASLVLHQEGQELQGIRVR